MNEYNSKLSSVWWICLFHKLGKKVPRQLQKKIPQEPISERIGEQSEVIEVDRDCKPRSEYPAYSGADPSLTVSRLSKLSLRSEFLKGCGKQGRRCRGVQEL